MDPGYPGYGRQEYDGGYRHPSASRVNNAQHYPADNRQEFDGERYRHPSASRINNSSLFADNGEQGIRHSGQALRTVNTMDQQVNAGGYGQIYATAVGQSEKNIRGLPDPPRSHGSYSALQHMPREALGSQGPAPPLLPVSHVGPGNTEDVALLRKMLAQVTAELGKQISAGQNDSRIGDASRADWLQKLVLQMEAKLALGETELREFKAKFSLMQTKLEGQVSENDSLRENLSRATRGGHPMASEATMTRENQMYRSQAEDLTKKLEIMQRTVQHFEVQQEKISSENGHLMLRLQGAEQRTDQLMKQKSAMDEQLHQLHAQLAAQQQQFAKSESQYKEQLQKFQQRCDQDAHRLEEEQQQVQALHNQIAHHQQQFDKQRSLLVQQRDGVQAGFQQELKEAIEEQTKFFTKTQELESQIARMKNDHFDDVRKRESSYVHGIKEMESKVQEQQLLLSKINDEKEQLLSKNDELSERLKNAVNSSKFLEDEKEQLIVKVEALTVDCKKIEVLTNELEKERAANKVLNEQMQSDVAAKKMLETEKDQLVVMIKSLSEELQKDIPAKKMLETEKEQLVVQLKSLTEAIQKEVAAKNSLTEEMQKEVAAKKLIETEKEQLVVRLEAMETTVADQKSIADLKEKAIADLKEEIIKMNQVLEAKQGQMNAEVMALKKQSDEMEAALRKEIVEENVRLNQLIQQTNDDHSKEEREWRKKQLDKEREYASQIEALERMKLQVEEEMHVKIKGLEKESESKVEQVRKDCNAKEEELRKRGYAREQEFADKQEKSRAEYLKAQEEHQFELQKKEEDFRKQVGLKDQEFQKHLESMLQGKVNAQSQELHKMIAEKDAALQKLQTDASKQQQQAQQQQAQQLALVQNLSAQVASHMANEEELARQHALTSSQLTEAQTARQQLKQQLDTTAVEVDSLKKRTARLQESLGHKDTELALLAKERDQLTSDLTTASQTLLKRGDDFSESVRLLQRRLESSDSNSKALHEKLREAHATNAKLSAELEQRGGSLRQTNGEAEHLNGRIRELEAYIEQVQPRIDSTVQENDTLTAEMDKVLAENAQLRNELDDLQDRVENSQVLMGHTPNRVFVQRAAPPPALLHPARSASSTLSAKSRDDDEHPRRTSGVHGLRLLRYIFGAWLNLIVDMRGEGRNSSFRCLNHFVDNDGHLAPFMPIGRIRKCELDIKQNEKVGSGTFADVFRCELKIPCAAKRLKGNAGQKELVEFVREGEMLRKMNHPSICKMLGVMAAENQHTLVCEYVAGTNLFDYLHKYHKTIPIGKQIAISVQICDAMAYVHECNLIHRDLKPQNVIYQERTGIAKLCDFGLARVLPNNLTELHPAQLGTGGTPAYQGPEVLKRQPVSKKIDLYGFAITLWEMYTTRLPWSDCNLEQMTTRVVVQNERPPIPKDMPREYSDVVQRSWHREPRLRPEFSDVLPVLRELHEALNPGSKLSSASSVGSGSSTATVVSLVGHSSTRAQGYQNADPNIAQPRNPISNFPGHSGNSSSAIFGPF